MQRLAPVLFVLMIALSGCANSPDYVAPPEPVDEAPPAREPEPEPEPEPVPPAPQPHAPILDAAISVVNGTAPLNVTIHVAGSDDDGDALTWNLFHNGTLNATGDTLPVEMAFVLPAGNHTFQVTLSDGAHAVNETFIVDVAEAVVASQALEEAIRGKSPGCLPEADYAATGEGYLEVPVVPSTIGHPFFTHFASASAFDAFLILDADGAELHRAVVGLTQANPEADDFLTWTDAGTVPEGAALLVFAACDNTYDSAPPQADGGPEIVRYIAGPDAAPMPFS